MPELGEQRPPRALIRLGRVALPAGPVVSEHQLPPEALTQRVRGDEGLELGDEMVCAALVELRVDQLLAGDEPQLVEPARLARGEGLVPDVEERRAAPERQGLAQHICAGACLRLAGTTQQALELECVDLLVLDLEQVAGRYG